MNNASQPRRWSLVEAIANVAIGYGVAFLSQLVVFPMFNIHISVRENLIIGAIFTVISIVRSYFVRRAFNRLHVAMYGA